MQIIMEQTADLIIEANPKAALDLMFNGEERETSSGLRYIILQTNLNESSTNSNTT
jgi:hypothetical protein